MPVESNPQQTVSAGCPVALKHRVNRVAAVRVNDARDHLAAGAAFAGDQDAAATVSGPLLKRAPPEGWKVTAPMPAVPPDVSQKLQ